MSLTVSAAPLSPAAELSRFEQGLDGAGAVVSFSGYVRAEADTLTLTHYPDFTESKILDFVKAAQERWPLTAWRIYHRIGDMNPAEAIVFVATASAHRRAAFEAADFLMDALKTRAPLWKQERRDGKTVWIDPKDQDHSDQKRWTT